MAGFYKSMYNNHEILDKNAIVDNVMMMIRLTNQNTKVLDIIGGGDVSASNDIS